MKTKKLILGLSIALLGNVAAHAQGLEGVIVEKYYKSNAADAASATDPVPLGSVTYRVYADLAAGYKIQALYGESSPFHELKVQTTTSFFNNQDRGQTTANAIPNAQLKNNTVAIDSWFSMGAASGATMGVLKNEDDNVMANLIGPGHSPAGLLVNSPAFIGAPLATSDGLMAGTPEAVTFVGLAGAEDVFGATGGNSFVTSNGSVASLNGSTGPLANNKVLIGQFTTDGVFTFELNMQVGNGTVTEKWVAKNPVGAEQTMSSLTGEFGVPPVVSITAPTTGANYVTGDVVNITATATDGDGVAQVEFFVDGVSKGVDLSAAYAQAYTSTVGTHTLTATATDNVGQSATSSNVIINVVNNVLPTVTLDAPSNGATYITGTPINFSATAADADGTIDSVVFYRGAVRVGKALETSSPFTYTLTSTVGAFALTAKAYDNRQAVTTSNVKNITVGNNVLPTVSVTAPANGSSVLGGVTTTTVTITASAVDTDGSVTQVEFFVDGNSVGSDATAPYSFDWVSTGAYATFAITAVATDDFGGVKTSSVVSFTIDNPNGMPYKISKVAAICAVSNFCLPISKVLNPAANVIGYDMVLHYNKTKVTPTGVITAGNALINPAYTTIANTIDAANGLVNISVSLNNAAPSGTTFNGIGELICVGFNKTANFASIDTALFTITGFEESYFTGVAYPNVDGGNYSTYKDSTFHGSLKFWSDNSPIKFDPLNTATYLATDIFGNDTACANKSLTSVKPDLAGNFDYQVSASNVGKQTFNIERDIAGTTSVQPVVNGFDALLARKVVVNDLSYIPSVYEIMAMDVNQDGVISAGDITQMNQRSVLSIPEFKQKWNYNAAGVNVAGKPSHDWVFVDGNTLTTNGAYVISSVYPATDGVGYSKSHVPVAPTCIAAPVADPNGCPVITPESYSGILLGDVNGNYQSIAVNGTLKSLSDDKIVFDLSNAVVTEGYVNIPVTVVSNNTVNALDFAMQFNDANLTYETVLNNAAYLDAFDENFNTTDSTLRFTSYSMQNFDVTTPIVSVRVASSTGTVSPSDLKSLTGYLNGDQVNVEVIDNNSVASAILNGNVVSVYPNPATETINVLVSEDASVQVIDMNGVVIKTVNVTANQKSVITTENLASGVYSLKVANANFVTVKMIVVAK